MPTPAAPSRRAPPAPAAEAFGLLRDHSLATLTQREIERRITTGELASGSRINESDLAEALGVSRSPVREALRALDQAGLVRVEKNRGFFVRQLTLAEADEIYEVRAVLEGLVGRLAARLADAAALEDLRAVLRRMAGAERGRRPEAYFELNLEFHDRLAQASGNRALLAHYRRVVNELELYRRETLAHGPETIVVSTREHQAIVDAIAARDEDQAEQLLTEHVRRSRERLHAVRGDLPAGVSTPAPATESAPPKRTRIVR